MLGRTSNQPLPLAPRSRDRPHVRPPHHRAGSRGNRPSVAEHLHLLRCDRREGRARTHRAGRVGPANAASLGFPTASRLSVGAEASAATERMTVDNWSSPPPERAGGEGWVQVGLVPGDGNLHVTEHRRRWGAIVHHEVDVDRSRCRGSSARRDRKGVGHRGRGRTGA